MRHARFFSILIALLCLQVGTLAAAEGPATYDEALAKSVGADAHGMRTYVLVILKTGPTPLPEGPERDEMFRGHFANIQRLADEGKLAVAGPPDRVDGWRGLYVLAVPTVEAAKPIVATDPVIQKGEMVAEYHTFFSSAALMKVNELHARIQKPGS